MHNGQTAGESGQVSWRRERQSGGATFVVVMQSADVWDWDDRAAGWRLGSPLDGSILVQREVSAPLVIVRAIAGHELADARFMEHDHVIETVATSGTNKSLGKCILPRRARGCEQVANPHRLRSGAEAVKRVIAIVDQVSGRLVPRKGLAKLLGRPRRRGMRGDRD